MGLLNTIKTSQIKQQRYFRLWVLSILALGGFILYQNWDYFTPSYKYHNGQVVFFKDHASGKGFDKTGIPKCTPVVVYQDSTAHNYQAWELNQKPGNYYGSFGIDEGSLTTSMDYCDSAINENEVNP